MLNTLTYPVETPFQKINKTSLSRPLLQISSNIEFWSDKGICSLLSMIQPASLALQVQHVHLDRPCTRISECSLNVPRHAPQPGGKPSCGPGIDLHPSGGTITDVCAHRIGSWRIASGHGIGSGVQALGDAQRRVNAGFQEGRDALAPASNTGMCIDTVMCGGDTLLEADLLSPYTM